LCRLAEFRISERLTGNSFYGTLTSSRRRTVYDRFAPLMFHPLDVSPTHWTFHFLDVSPPRRLAPRTFRPLYLSPSGRFAQDVAQSKAKQRCVMDVGRCFCAQLVQTKNKQCKSAVILQCYHPHLSDFCSRLRLCGRNVRIASSIDFWRKKCCPSSTGFAEPS